MISRITLLLMIFVQILIFGCKKDSEDNNPTPTPTDQTAETKSKLTAHYWRLSYEHESYTNNGFTVTLASSAGACYDDDRYTFNADGKLIKNPYTNNTCGEFADTSDWQLNSATVLRTKMWLSPFNINDYTILELSDNSLKLATYFADLGNPPSWFYRDTLQYVYP